MTLYKLFGANKLQDRIQVMGQEISRDYKEKDLVLICILKGSVIFMSDLIRQISIPVEIDFMAVSSYKKGVRESTGVVEIIKDLSGPIDNRHILIIEDIIDTGHTLDYIIRNLWTRNPASLRICTLLDKPERRKVEIPVDYIGFEVPDVFVVGYGLDIDEKFRQLPFVGVKK